VPAIRLAVRKYKSYFEKFLEEPYSVGVEDDNSDDDDDDDNSDGEMSDMDTDDEIN
jgi:hypothetical protein